LPPVPSDAQLAWQRLEMTMFLHFGVNTFTDREWGDGKEDPNLFRPEKLDCKQWVTVAKEAGFGMMILTAKHHDGFCLWPSAYTEHSVLRSAWREGEGDVMREFTEACRAQGVKAGFYLSPWDRHDPRYGGEEYNTYFKNQLAELMAEYAPIEEVWFDGASEGEITPYDWKGFYETVYALNPDAVIAICGPDIRWVGNESGVAREGESSVQDPHPERHFDATDKVWYPAECDVSIRPGWFYHASEDARVKSVDHLLEIYFKSVGRNSVLLLNVPPTPEGRFAEEDVTRLREFRAALDEIFETDLAGGGTAKASSVRGDDAAFAADRALDGNLDTYWATDDEVTTGWLELQFPEPRTLNVVNVQEALFLGERVRRYHVEAWERGRWNTIGSGTIIGHRNLLRTRPVETDRLRLVVDEAEACPAIARFGAHFNPRSKQVASGSLAAHKPARASNVHPGGTQWGGDKAVDDDMDTRWATADDVRACWLEVDLLKPETFRTVRIRELQPRIERYCIEYRDGPEEEWQVAHEGAEAGTDHRATFGAVTARYVRLHILEASFAPTIWEFRVLE
jgi:alpha-L-fucosidase